MARYKQFKYLGILGPFLKRNMLYQSTVRILQMSWGVKTTCFEAPGVSLGGSGVSIRGVKIVRETKKKGQPFP